MCPAAPAPEGGGAGLKHTGTGAGGRHPQGESAALFAGCRLQSPGAPEGVPCLLPPSPARQPRSDAVGVQPWSQGPGHLQRPSVAIATR